MSLSPKKSAEQQRRNRRGGPLPRMFRAFDARDLRQAAEMGAWLIGSVAIFAAGFSYVVAATLRLFRLTRRLARVPKSSYGDPCLVLK